MSWASGSQASACPFPGCTCLSEGRSQCVCHPSASTQRHVESHTYTSHFSGEPPLGTWQAYQSSTHAGAQAGSAAGVGLSPTGLSGSNPFGPGLQSYQSSYLANGMGTVSPWQTITAPSYAQFSSTQTSAAQMSLDYAALDSGAFGDGYDDTIDYADPAEDAADASPLADGTGASALSTSGELASPTSATAEKPKRKRGRPKLDRSEHGSDDKFGPASMSGRMRVSQRVPHNEVERKYREGLNQEFERLRMAVPTLPQSDPNSLTSPPRPSKATVIASSIDYIKHLESEHARLAEENAQLRDMREAETTAKGGGRRNSKSGSKKSGSSSSGASRDRRR